MHFSTALIAFIAFTLKVQASPANSNLATRSINLSNGNSTVVVEVAADADSASVSKRWGDVNCKGSSLCTNAQGFKNQCLTAYSLIEDRNYWVGGDKRDTGVCSGNCGIFVQSTPGQLCDWLIPGQFLRNSYDRIRAAGCQACGSDLDGACQVTINYVTGC